MQKHTPFIRADTSLVFKVFQLSILWWVCTIIFVLGPTFLPSFSWNQSKIKYFILMVLNLWPQRGRPASCWWWRSCPPGPSRAPPRPFPLPWHAASSFWCASCWQLFWIQLINQLLLEKQFILTSHRKLAWTVSGYNGKWKSEYQKSPCRALCNNWRTFAWQRTYLIEESLMDGIDWI